MSVREQHALDSSRVSEWQQRDLAHNLEHERGIALVPQSRGEWHIALPLVQLFDQRALQLGGTLLAEPRA